MTVTVVLLSSPGRSFDISQSSDILSPIRFLRHLAELGVLKEHSSDDAEERFVGREDGVSSSENVALTKSCEMTPSVSSFPSAPY